MNTSPTLSAADAASIRNFLIAAGTRPGIPPTSRAALEQLLDEARVRNNEAAVLESHVGLHNPVTLVNPDDPSDWYRMEIVTPAETDVNSDRISLTHPMCLAVLGRRTDESVAWDTGHGIRRMRVAAVEKSALAGV